MSVGSLITDLLATMRLTRIGPLLWNNVDPFRYPEFRPFTWAYIKFLWMGIISRLANRLGWVCFRRGEWEQIAERLRHTLGMADGLAQTYGLLVDNKSREQFLAILSYQILRAPRYRLPLNKPEYWRTVRRIQTSCKGRAHSKDLDGALGLDEFDLTPLGYDVRLEAHLMHAVATFGVEQYCYQNEGLKVGAEPADVVIDGGGCWGDTALYFALRVGEHGKVYSFEFCPENVQQFQKNLNRNPRLLPRIQVITSALWARSGEELLLSPHDGPSSSVFATPANGRLQEKGAASSVSNTRAIDDFVTAEGLDRVDFIKLDIEGAEFEALRGAEKVLRTFRPKLAVSLYHNLDDFVRIPSFLASLDLGYEFFLDHFTIHAEETILFARPRK
jgi:FkbM family methyltransferase